MRQPRLGIAALVFLALAFALWVVWRCGPSEASGRSALEVASSESGSVSQPAPARIGRGLDRRSAAGAGGRSAAPGAANPSASGSATAGAVKISGWVLDALGGPVIGAVVLARAAADEPPLSQTTSQQNGEFELAVPEAHVQVEARAEAYSVALAQVLAPMREVTLVMAPSASIVGRVVARDTGNGVSDVTVTAFNASGVRIPPQSVRSDEAGSFRVDSMPGGGYSLTAASARWRGGPVWVSVGVGQASEEVRLVVMPATMFTARVNVDGQPCGDGQIMLTGGPRAFARFADDGKAVLQGVAPGRYRLLAVCRGALPREESVEVGLEPVEQVWELKVGLAVRGRVESSSGQAVSGAPIRVGPVSTDGTAARLGNISVSRCVSDDTGEFSCGGLDAGTYEVRAENNRRLLGPTTTVELAGGEPHVVLRLDAAGSIRASFDGALAGAGPVVPVFVRGADGWPISGRTSQAVTWFEGLPLGHYEVFGGQPTPESVRAVDLVEPDRVVDVRLAAVSFRTIAGRVLDEAGVPVVDAWVRAQSAARVMKVPTNAGRPVLTDEAGAFEIDGLPPGEYDVECTSPAGEGRLLGVSAGSDALTVKFETYGRLTGSVVTASGQRPAAFVVSYVRKGGPGGQVSGVDGRWVLPWAPPGEYRLTVSTDVRKTTSQAQLAPGGEAAVHTVVGSSP